MNYEELDLRKIKMSNKPAFSTEHFIKRVPFISCTDDNFWVGK